MGRGVASVLDGATWVWDGRRERFRIDASRQGPFGDLAGEWSLTGMGAWLEGFSRRRLRQALQSGGQGDPLDCALTLSNGRKVRLVGAFEGEGGASGDLVADEPAIETPRPPGPDLEPAYQPIVSLKDGRIVGFEALARWTGADALPSVAERLEDDALALNMLIHAAETLAIWRRAGAGADMFVHVNLTGRDLARGDAPSLVEALIQGHRLEPGALKVELTEQAALRDAEGALEAAKAMKAAGAGLVLDDFGAGHSSFAWLADMPADGLKIDADLIARLGDPRTDMILEAVALLARRLGMTATAEGVESRSDSARLRALGFDQAQGFAFAYPLTRSDALAFIKAQPTP